MRPTLLGENSNSLPFCSPSSPSPQTVFAQENDLCTKGARQQVWTGGAGVEERRRLGGVMGQMRLLMVSHYCRECLLCKKPFWTLPAQDPRGRSLRECGSWSWKQEVDPVLIKCNPCPSHGFPLPHPRLSVQTSAL